MSTQSVAGSARSLKLLAAAAVVGVVTLAVFAVPSSLAEDEVMAAIVLKGGAELDPADLMRHLEPRLAYCAIPATSSSWLSCH